MALRNSASECVGPLNSLSSASSASAAAARAGRMLYTALSPAARPRPRVGGRAAHLRDEGQPLLIADELPAQLHDPVAQERGLLELQVLRRLLHLLLHVLDQPHDLVLRDGAGDVGRSLLRHLADAVRYVAYRLAEPP